MFGIDIMRATHRGVGRRLALAMLASALGGAAAAAPVDPGVASLPTTTFAHKVLADRDAAGQPFAVIDKVAATVVVFSGDGAVLGGSPVLLGLARGDTSVPGIGTRPLAAIRPAERTTPAGRFPATMGMNTAGHAILWVDYDAAISLHAVVTSKPGERRLERLASPTPSDNRISYGCINVPAAFFRDIIVPTFSDVTGIVYVLPEMPVTAAR